jgi:hypothetical protein
MAGGVVRFRPGVAGLVLGVVAAVAPATAATAADYPPSSEGQGTVTPSRIKAGECADFAGDGFAPLATITVSDNGTGRGTTEADLQGSFSDHLCFDSTTKPGKHELRGNGRTTDGSLRVVVADLTVQGVSQTHGSSKGGSAQRSLPAADAETRNAAFSGAPLLAGTTVGALLVGGLAWTLLVAEVRHRRQRRRA